MDRRDFLFSTAIGSVALGSAGRGAAADQSAGGGIEPHGQAGASPREAVRTRKILISGGEFGAPFLRYMAALTGKPKPRFCYLPTANADRPEAMVQWYRTCVPLGVEPFVQESFIASSSQPRGWDEVLLSMDAIVVSGGNTLNQQAIWRAQGIDAVLRDAWDRGIVLGGASAGSLCWFEEGTTDSRPKALSIVRCLGFLPGSHCPHYDAEKDRRPLYQRLIASGEMKPGYACDNDAGIYFEGTQVSRVVATRPESKVYYVSVADGTAVEKVLQPEIIS